MIVALFCVAAAMIAGGAWAVFTGWEFIIIERGWTQVLLGGMLVTGGVLLGGLGVLAVHVKRLAGKLDQIPATRPSLSGKTEAAKREEMPQPPSRQEPSRQEPPVRAASEPVATQAPQAEKPAAPEVPAPAAIALGAAAGAGTAAVASAIMASTSDQKPELEDETARDFAEQLSSEERMPTPDGEDAGLIAPSEQEFSSEQYLASERKLPSEEKAIEPEAATEVEPLAVPQDEERPITPVEETAQRERPEDAEREPFLEPEELHSAQEEALPVDDKVMLPAETIPEVEAPLAEEQRPVAAWPSDAFPLEPQVRVGAEEPRLVEEPHAVEKAYPEEDKLAEPEPEPAALQPDAPARDEGVPEPAPEQQLAEPEDAPQPPPRTLVGTYESGGNVYTMYSDGSIDAQTPSGQFRFSSLEELKNFIAEGGEDPLA